MVDIWKLSCANFSVPVFCTNMPLTRSSTAALRKSLSQSRRSDEINNGSDASVKYIWQVRRARGNTFSILSTHVICNLIIVKRIAITYPCFLLFSVPKLIDNSIHQRWAEQKIKGFVSLSLFSHKCDTAAALVVVLASLLLCYVGCSADLKMFLLKLMKVKLMFLM